MRCLGRTTGETPSVDDPLSPSFATSARGRHSANTQGVMRDPPSVRSSPCMVTRAGELM